MEEHTKVNIIAIRSMDSASTNGLMVAFTKASGKTANNMAKDILPNLTAQNRKESGIMANESNG